jgi:hypothetical protein
MSKIMCCLFITTFDSWLLISIALRCAYAITCTYVDCCTSTYTFVDGYTSASMMFSSLAFICTACASTNYNSTTLSFSNSSMNIESIDVLLVLSIVLYANIFCFCAKTQLQTFQSYLYHELLFAQIISSHYMPFLLHISKMMNTAMTLQPMTKYSTCLHALHFSTPLPLLFFSTIILRPLTCIYAHSFVLPFPLLLFIVFQSHFLHSCYELQNFENAHNFQ